MQNTRTKKGRSGIGKSRAAKPVKAKKRARKNGARKNVVLTVGGVPIAVHNRIKRYRVAIIGRDKKNYDLMQAYAEFLKEYSKRLQL